MLENLFPNNIQLHGSIVHKLILFSLSWSIAFISAFSVAPVLFAQEVIGTITHTGFRPWSLAVYEAGDKLFVGDRETGNLLIYDGTSLDLLAELPIDGGSGGSSFVVHEASGKLFFSTFPYGNHMAVIDAGTNELIEYLEIDGQGKAIDQDLGKVYTIRRYGPFILYSIDAYTHSSDSVELSNAGLTSGLETNPVSHEVFIGYLQGNALDIVDGTTMELTTVPGINGRGIVVNWLENKVYGEKGTFDGFWMYDRDMDSMKVCTTYNDANPEIFNPATNRVHTGSEVNGQTTIIEGTDDSWFNMPMHGGTVGLGIRHSTNHVYYVGFDYIVVLDGTTLDWLAEIPNVWLDHPSIYDIAINQSTGRVFVSYSDGPEESNTIVVIQDSAVIIEPDISVIPDTLCFGMPPNKKSSDDEAPLLLRATKRTKCSLPQFSERRRSAISRLKTHHGDIDTLQYDDGIPGHYYCWGNGARMASRMSPAEACKLLAIQIYCCQAQSYKVGLYDWTGSVPGAQLLETGVVYSTGQGWHTTDVSSYEINIDGDFIASFNMIDTVACLGFDTFDNGRAWDYNGATWSAWDETYFIRTIVEYGTETTDTVRTMTINNLGNTDLQVGDITTGHQWIASIEPRTFVVAPHGSRAVTVTVSTAGLSSGTHYGSLNILSNDPDENPYSEPVKYIVPLVGVEDKHTNIPKRCYLSQNYPNPFNPTTTIRFATPLREKVVLSVFDLLGRKVATLLDKEVDAGEHSVIFNASNLPSGVYFYRLQAGRFMKTKKLVVLK